MRKSTPENLPPKGSLRAEFRSLSILAFPLAVIYVGNQLMGAVDAAIVGRLGEVPLSAVGLGNGVFFSIAVFGTGLVMGLDPLVSQAVGAKEHGRTVHFFRQSMVLAVAVSLPVAGLTVLVLLFLESFGIEPAVAEETRGYVFARLLGLPAFLLLLSARTYLQAYDHTRALVIGMIVANVINAPFSWLLVFGDPALVAVGLPELGIPQLSATGAGIMSSVSSVIQLVIGLLAARRLMTQKSTERLTSAFAIDRAVLGRMFRLGLPIGLTLMAEVASFGLVSIFIGTLGSLPLAAHTVALTLISTTFQVPLAIGSACAVRVGQAIGRNDAPGTRRAGLAGFISGGGFMMVMALFLFLSPESAARLFTDKSAVITAVVPLLFAAAVFQFVDGIQAVGAGALRGAGDTRFAFGANMVGHYLFGLPIGAALGWSLGLGAEGFWWGLAIGLTVVAGLLLFRFLQVSAKPIGRS